MGRSASSADASRPNGGVPTPAAVDGSSLARQMALVAATLYGSAALLVGVSLLASWRVHAHPGVVASVAAAGLVVALGFMVTAVRLEVPMWVHLVAAAFGSVLVGVLVVAAGPTFAAVYGVLLLYVVAFSLYYFPTPIALAQVGFAALVYALALIAVDGSSVPRLSYWTVVVGAAVIGSGLVGALGHRTRELLEREHHTAQRLAELDRRKDAFLRVVAHDLRSPLVNIIGGADTIASHLDELGPETVRDLARRQARQGRRLDRLVGDLLDLERLRSRALHPERRHVRLDELVRGVLDAVDLRGRPVHVEADAVEVMGDPTMLERVVDNLLANAVKHTPADSAIDVRLGADEARVRLVVADRGPGVPEDQRETIFELFSSETAGGTGSGVGLALVREVVTAHQGTVGVEDRPGGGAAFWVVLPSAADQ